MEESLTTREKILYTSLRLFANKGYDGVSMREIAAAVGIKGASIYNHFKGKEAIFEAIFEEMIRRYEVAAQGMNIPQEPGAEAVTMFFDIAEEQLLKLTEELFFFFAKDEFAVLFRRLITAEQQRSARAAECLKNYYLEAPVVFQQKIFEGLQQRGKFVKYDARMMAVHFYSTIYYNLGRYDLGYSYEECLGQLKEHVHWYCQIYRA